MSQLRKLWQNKVTFWFLHETEGALKRLTIRAAWLIYVPAAMIVLLFASSLLLSSFFGSKVNEDEMARLRNENQRLTQKYQAIKSTLNEVSTRVDQLAQKETAIRALFNLPEVSPQERQLGIGGPDAMDWLPKSESEEIAVATEAEVDKLLKQTEFEFSKYGEIEGALLGLRERLDHTPSIWPAKGWFSRGFGMHYDPFTGYKQMHRGIDIAAQPGTPIIAPAKGKVIFAGWDSGGLGNLVVVEHGYGFVTRHGHMSKVLVKRGQEIARGDRIGLMGSTGYSTGSHLHYEIYRNGKALNPMEYILN
ncbi:MAG: M23 family metallopeptidase [bacterium]|nr:M23 family metallopeptidase [bacterium]